MRRWIAAVVLIASTAAHASPIELQWERRQRCQRSSIAIWNEAITTVERDHLVLLDRETGKPGTPIALTAPPEAGAVRPGWTESLIVGPALGNALVLNEGTWFAVFDRTGRLLWHDGWPPSNELPFLYSVGGDLVVAPHPKGDLLQLERRAGGTGAVKWRASTGLGNGELYWLADDGVRLYAVTAPDWYGDHVKVNTFDLATGAWLWEATVPTNQPKNQAIPFPSSHFAAGAGQLFAAVMREGIRVYDGATGALTKIAVADVGQASDALVVRDGWVYVAQTHGVAAIDLTARRPLWTAAIASASVIGVTADAVYALGLRDMLYAFDPATGARLATYGVAITEIATTPRDGRGPIYVGCSDDRLVALGPSAIVQPPEHATITGKLLCRQCGERGRSTPLEKIEVSAGDATAQTDATGAFALAVTGRGSLRVRFALPDGPRNRTWSDPSRVVTLHGNQRYAIGSIGARRLEIHGDD